MIEVLVRVKRERNGKLTIGLQMVLMPAYGDQIVPLAKFGKELGVDYFLIKHCSDDEAGRIGVDYSWYTRPESLALLSEAERESTDTYSVQVKWSKIKTGRDRRYSKCMGTPFLLQLSGTGVVAPCASFFHSRYKERWIGDLRRERWRDIWASERYWEVINELRSERFDPRVMCETLCLQDNVNEALFNLVEKGDALPQAPEEIHGPNFV
jgi:MoaA/NifB/PqqE/SkfB family radical SAM enzyme